jgi:hypothetical protein
MQMMVLGMRKHPTVPPRWGMLPAQIFQASRQPIAGGSVYAGVSSSPSLLMTKENSRLSLLLLSMPADMLFTDNGWQPSSRFQGKKPDRSS